MLFGIFCFILLQGCIAPNLKRNVQNKPLVIGPKKIKLPLLKNGGRIIYRYRSAGDPWFSAPPKKYFTKIMIVNGNSTNLTTLYDTSSNLIDIRLSPDKKKIAYLRETSPNNHSLGVIEASTGKRIITKSRLGNIWQSSYEWSDDGEYLRAGYSGKDAKNLSVVRINPNLKFNKSFYNKIIRRGSIDWLSNSKLAYNIGDRLESIDVNGNRRIIYSVKDKGISLASWHVSQSGKIILIYELKSRENQPDIQSLHSNPPVNGKIKILYSGKNGFKVYRTIKVSGRFETPLWSPLEDKIILKDNSVDEGSPPYGVSRLLLVNLNGGVRNITKFGEANVRHSVAWSPNGEKLAIIKTYIEKGNSKLYLVDVKTNVWQYISEWKDDSQRLHDIQWSPDMKSILFQTIQREGINLKIYDLASKEVRPLTSSPGIYEIIGWIE